MVVLPPWLRCGGCSPGSVSGTCWLALVALLCLWTPGSCGVPSLHVRSPISGPVCVLPQSTVVTLLLGLRAVPLPQADAVGFGLRWSARLSGLLTGRC